MQDLTLMGHLAFLRHYVVQLQALSHAAPIIGTKLRQIAHSLDADADELERIASGQAVSEAQEPGSYASEPATAQRDAERNSDAAFADCLDAIRQGVDAALRWPRPTSD